MNARCILGLEEEENAAGGGGDDGGRASRQRRRFANMWDGARPLFEEFLGQPDLPEAIIASPVPQRAQPHFNVESCIQLLSVLPPSERDLRADAIDRLRAYMDADRNAEAMQPAPTVPRRRHRHRVYANRSSSSSSSAGGSD